MRAVGAYAACPRCGGGLPGEVHDDLVCRCGIGDADLVIAWEQIEVLVRTRSGGKCEIRSPQCLAARFGYDVFRLPDYHRSLHHRRPRGMGGSRRVDTHTAAAVVLTCGHGTIGCHFYAERHREWAFARGLLVPQRTDGEATDPAEVPITLHSGRRVRLDPYGPGYLDPHDGIAYAV